MILFYSGLSVPPLNPQHLEEWLSKWPPPLSHFCRIDRGFDVQQRPDEARHSKIEKSSCVAIPRCSGCQSSWERRPPQRDVPCSRIRSLSEQKGSSRNVKGNKATFRKRLALTRLAPLYKLLSFRRKADLRAERCGKGKIESLTLNSSWDKSELSRPPAGF